MIYFSALTGHCIIRRNCPWAIFKRDIKIGLQTAGLKQKCSDLGSGNWHLGFKQNRSHMDLRNQTALSVGRKCHSTLKRFLGAILRNPGSKYIWWFDLHYLSASVEAASELHIPESSDLTRARIQFYGKGNLPVHLPLRL